MGLNFNTLTCCICGQEITGSYYTDIYKRPACGLHHQTICYCCGRFCDPAKSRFVPRYGHFCGHCEQRKVTAESAVRMAGVINKFYRENRILTPPYKLYIVDTDQMFHHGKSTGTNPVGLATWRHAPPAENRRTNVVYLLDSLSRTLAASVMAHEVLHLWQYERYIKAPQVISEGFCNLGSYLFLQYINREESLHHGEMMMRDRDPVYGQGFRDIKAEFDKGGWKGVVSLLKSYCPEKHKK